MVRRAIFWAFSGQAFTFVISFAGSVFVARLLSPRELGIFAVAMAVMGILQIVASFGTAAYIVKEPVLHENALAAAFTVNTLLSLGLAAILLAASYPVASFLNEAAVAPVLQLLAITPLIGILEFRPSAMLQRAMQFKAMSLINTARTAAGVLATVVAATQGASYMSPAYGALCGSVVGLAGFLMVGRSHFSLRLSSHDWRAMTTFGIQMMSISGISVAAVRLSDLIMGRLLGLEVLGLYSRATNLSNLLFTNIYGTATRIVFVKLAHDFRERGVVRDTFLPSLRIVGGIMGPVLVGIAVLSGPIIGTLYGPKWIAAAPVLSILMAAQFVSLAFAMNWELFVIRNELGRQTKFEISRSIFGVMTQTIGCLFNMLAAAASSVVDAFFSVWLYAPHIRRLSEAHRGELVAIHSETALLSLVAVVPSLLTMVWFDWDANAPLLPVCASIVAGTGLWIWTLFRVGHPLAAELKSLVQVGVRKFSS